MCVIQHKKRSNFKKRLYSIIIRTRERGKNLRISIENINFAPDLVAVAQKIRIKY